jgi:hypothetical protein
MTPEAYIAAVKACPRIAWIDYWNWNRPPKDFYRGYATWCDGKDVEIVPDNLLASEETLRDYASQSTPGNLRAKCPDDPSWLPRAHHGNFYSPIGSFRYCMGNFFFGEIPSDSDLHAYFVNKHGDLRGLDRLFPRRIVKRAAVEWIVEQLERQGAKRKAAAQEERARYLWERYYCMFDEDHVTAMSGAEFETFVGKLYTRLGYSVSLTQGGADQGVDLILSKDGHKIAVQAKRWAGSVGNKAVQQAIAGKLYYACSHGMIVTSSTFSNSAIALAAKDPTISLVDGRALGKLCEQFRTAQIPAFSWDEWEKIKHVAERFG